MFKRIFCLVGWFCLQSSPLPLAALLLMANCSSVKAEQLNVPTSVSPLRIPYSQSLIEVPEKIVPDMIELGEQIDPLDSPHPIPWNWVLATHAEMSANDSSGLRYYRSQSLVSPDGNYAAYSRIQMHAQPELYRSRVTSVMFVENLQTGDLRTITPSSPLADNPLISDQQADMAGTIAILIPISWSSSSERILGRQFEGMLSSSDASDYAVIWDRRLNNINTLAPEQIDYSNAILLGWSQTNPDKVLFRAGILGDEHWPIWAVAPDGDTVLAFEEEPIIYGQVINQVWAGPQARW